MARTRVTLRLSPFVELSIANQSCADDADKKDFDYKNVFMTLFEGTADNFAALGCTENTVACREARLLDVYYVWRSGRSSTMAWLEDPSDATKKTFMDAPLSLQGQLPTTANAILPTPSGNDYASVNLNLRFKADG